MGPGHMMWGGWWILPILMCIAMVLFCLLMFGRKGFKGTRMGCFDGDQSSNSSDSETSLEILKKRYAKGEINKDEFEQMKRDILS